MTTLAIEAPTAGRPARRRIPAALAALARARLVQFLAIGGARFLPPPRPRARHPDGSSAREPARAPGPPAPRARPPPPPRRREPRPPADELRRSYGASFADAVAGLAPSGRYSEPIASSFGWHRVRLVDVAPGGRLPFEAVQRQIAFDLALQHRQDAIPRFLDAAPAPYQFVVAGAPPSPFAP